MFRIICLLIGYFIGCLQSAYFVGKILGVDIRQHGSGNLGTTNALRVLGKKAAAFTFTCDVLKGLIAFAVFYSIFQSGTAGVYAAFGTVLGHDFPFYLKFRGGKGMASMAGMSLGLGIFVHPLLFLATFCIGLLTVILTKTVSVGALLFSVLVPVMCLIVKAETEVTAVTAVMCILAFYKHRDNLVRIKNGTENKLGRKKSEEA